MTDPSPQELVSRAELARRAGVSSAAITKATQPGKPLHDASVGNRIDAAHPDAVAYVQARTSNAQRKGHEPNARGKSDERLDEARDLVIQHQRASGAWLAEQLRVDRRRAMALRDALEDEGVISAAGPGGRRKVLVSPRVTEPDGAEDAGEGEPGEDQPKPRGWQARHQNQKAASNPAAERPFEMPDNVAEFADWTLRDIVRQFGTDTAFKDYLAALKSIEDYRDKHLKNDRAEGRLIPRDLVESHVIGAFERAHINLLTDVAQTIATRVRAMALGGSDDTECRDYVEKTISKTLKAAKGQVTQALLNDQ